MRTMKTNGFRGCRWGSGRDEIVENEGSEPIGEERNVLVYGTSLVGSECRVFYGLTEGRLAYGGYTIDHKDDRRDVADYLALKSRLEEKYGGPSATGTDWHPSLDVIPDVATESAAAAAVASGAVKFRASWTLEDSSIVAVLTADDQRNAYVGVFYYDNGYAVGQAESTRESDLAQL